MVWVLDRRLACLLCCAMMLWLTWYGQLRQGYGVVLFDGRGGWIMLVWMVIEASHVAACLRSLGQIRIADSHSAIRIRRAFLQIFSPTRLV